MGFSAFWKLYDEDAVDAEAALNAWLLIDYDNFVMDVLDASDGHLYLVEKRCNLIFNAIKNSEYKTRIHIFKDGSNNSIERAIIKLKRQHFKMLKKIGLNFLNKGSDSENCITIAFTIASRIFESLEFTVCDGEADPDIRLRARSLIDHEQSVTILSGDASLIIGLPSSVSIVNGKSLSVDPLKPDCLKWKPILVDNFLKKLNVATENALIIEKLKEITSDHLPLLAALLGSEWDCSFEENDPSQLITYMKYYMYAKKAEHDEGLKRNLFAAATLIRLWITPTKIREEGLCNSVESFLSCCAATFNLTSADRLKIRNVPENLKLMGHLLEVTSLNPTSGQIIKYSIEKGTGSIGQFNYKFKIFENKIKFRKRDFHKFEFLQDLPKSIARGNVEVGYSIHEKEFARDIRFRNTYSESETNFKMDITLMAKELKRRLTDYVLDTVPLSQPPTIKYKLHWGSWSLYEPTNESYATNVSPLRCLIKQMNLSEANKKYTENTLEGIYACRYIYIYLYMFR